MSQKSQTRLLIAISLAMLAGLGALVGMRSSASLEGKQRSEALETLPDFDVEVALACTALIAIGLILYFIFGRNRQSATDGANFDDLLALQPAVLGRLTRENKPDADDITVTVLHLAQRGIIRVTPTTRISASGKEVPDYRLERVGPAGNQLAAVDNVETSEIQLANPVERATLNLLFDIAGEGANSVLLSDVHSFGRHHFQAFTQAAASWQKTLTDEVARCQLFDASSKKLQVAMAFCAGAFVLCGALMLLATGSPLPLICLLVTALVYALIAQRMPRPTQGGADLLAQAETLHAWLDSLAVSDRFAALDHAPSNPDHALAIAPEEWAAIMPRAFVLGKASDTIDALIRLNPNALASVNGGASVENTQVMQPSYAPWVLWYSESLAAEPCAGTLAISQPSGIPHFAREVSSCICGTAFAAAATEASAQIKALNNPVQGATAGGGIPRVGGISTSPSPASNRMR